jgi:hypothetical protein
MSKTGATKVNEKKLKFFLESIKNGVDIKPSSTKSKSDCKGS